MKLLLSVLALAAMMGIVQLNAGTTFPVRSLRVNGPPAYLS
ncbi:MAG: hypothetical protein P8182_15610 [Deltaproteobacteria bacterium]